MTQWQPPKKAARSQYEMAKNGARQEDKAAAAAQVERAKGAVAEVSSYMDETILTAAADGEVTEIFPQSGRAGRHRCSDYEYRPTG